MESIFYLADKYGLFILEDAAHAFETITNAGKVGDTRYAAAFSFYANKNITTGGEGGAVSTNNEKIAKKPIFFDTKTSKRNLTLIRHFFRFFQIFSEFQIVSYSFREFQKVSESFQ